MGFAFDFRKFRKGLERVTRNVDKELADKAMFAAGNELLRDAIKVQPFAPFDEGHLRGSARTSRPKVGGGRAEIEAGVNIEYAARWHELTPEEDSRINWTRTGAKFPGRKYLEMKMSMFKNKYMWMVGKALGKVLGSKPTGGA